MINMNKRRLVLISIGVISFCLSVALITKSKIERHHVDDVVAQKILEWRNPLKVEKIQVITGNDYDILLEDGRRIKASLGVYPTPDSKDKVVNFLNRSSNPRVILKQQDDGCWLVSLYVVAKNTADQNVEIDLSTWLREKNLVYNGKFEHVRK